MNRKSPLCVALVLAVTLASCVPHESKLETFGEAMEAANRATIVKNKGVGPAIMSEVDVIEMISHYKLALSHAEKVDTVFLDSKYPRWGAHFESEFLAGLRLVLEAYETGDNVASIRGQMLMMAWGEWYNDHRIS